MMYFMFQQKQFFYLLSIFITQTISTPTTISISSLTTISTPYFSTTSTPAKRNPYGLDIKLIGIIIVCICLSLGTIRLCFLLCNSSHSSRRPSSNRRRSVIHPQVATIEQNQFKPDLPPAYAEVIANNDRSGSKLPSYDELQNEQYSRDAIVS
ncbi:unnamed protein product [Adineta steineri]|uniref:Uncharacterized protein n=1 Tax=Adineta steineri TaxID=433720 RepID=A0A815F2Y9_9BILA|nr:unnamed protein product [Adineta steineri]CAF1407177.1 unnamed protein product [Adineta steineri]CAF3599038.1 unnamed protein product [Adineta steineri]CAF3800431.1 unnamed protein product [Adineta steineri]